MGKELDKAVAEIIKDNIYFSGQLGDYVVHGAIEKIIELVEQECRKEAIAAMNFVRSDSYKFDVRTSEELYKLYCSDKLKSIV